MYKILVIGAHPDDCEVFAGGTSALWKRRGDKVRFLSLTNGSAGHHQLGREELIEVRRREMETAAAIIGVEHEMLDNDDGLLEPTVARRLEVIRRIRRFAPDLILTHRPNDYHPDHRYTSILVEDSSFLVTVPKICPDTPHLPRMPVVAYLYDGFRKPAPFQADVAVDIDPVASVKWDLMDAHASQFYEWVPYNEGVSHEIPADAAGRRRWIEEHWGGRLKAIAADARGKLVELYGPERGGAVCHAETFEICEYGARPPLEQILGLFPLRG